MLLALALTACVGFGHGTCGQPPAPVRGVTSAPSVATVSARLLGEHVHHAEHPRHHHDHNEPDGCEHECASCCPGHAPAVATVSSAYGTPLAPSRARTLPLNYLLELDPAPVRILHVPRPGAISG